MKIFITGGTGYVGRQIIRDLVKSGHSVTALIRSGSENKIPTELDGKINIVFGDIIHPETYRNSLIGIEAIINLPGLLREFPKKGIKFEDVHFLGTKILIDEAKKAVVSRFIQMSALGVRENSFTKYQQTKFKAEEYLKQSGLNFTIFRPSVIFGNEKEGQINFITVLSELLNLLPIFVPVVGKGLYKFQPASIENVSQGFVKALSTPESIGKTFEVTGKDVYTYNQILEMIMHARSNYKIKLYQPYFVMKILSKLLDRFPFFPISEGQLIMLKENSVSENWNEFYSTFGIQPIRLVETINKNLN
ncbi:MAG: complex I NDUFA9 subunit family protein [Bacteroidetes bacterium]|nr:complex I NDUFA9 subunit family protein [Bacteroidota bacterium]